MGNERLDPAAPTVRSTLLLILFTIYRIILKMKFLIRINIILVLTYTLISCGVMPASGSLFSAELPIPTDKAVIYFYSPPAVAGGAGCPKFKTQNGQLFSLPNGSYSRIELPPGSHTVSTETSWCYVMPLRISFEASAGSRIFFAIRRSHSYFPSAMKSSSPDSSWTGFVAVSEEVALKEINVLGRTN
jgi:Protein of unknown function (DUF2846)